MKHSCNVFVEKGSIPNAKFDLEKPSKSHRGKINNDNFLYTQSTYNIPYTVNKQALLSVQVHRTLYTVIFFFYDKLIVHMGMYTFTIACMYPMHVCSCIHSMFSVHANTDICASSMTTDRLKFHDCFHANIHAHTHQLVHITLYTLIVFFYDKLVVHMCIYTFIIACMYLLHACSCIHSRFLDRATTNISASSTTTDQCSINCFHASIHAHTHHHMHRTLYTLMFFFYDKLVAHMCMYTFTIVACIHCMHVHVFTPCFQCMEVPTYLRRLRQPINVP